MNRIYDISVPVSEATVTWPGDPEISLKNILNISSGNSCNLTNISMGAHTGTHIDAPNHFIRDGNTSDSIPLEIFVGDCLVAEFTGVPEIDIAFIKTLNLKGIERILFKTKNSLQRNSNKFNEDFISLSYKAALYLIEKKIKLIGIDYLSIESFHAKPGNPVHMELLENNIVILENINLSGINPGIYELICLPVFFKGIEASPVRAILREK
jgi:arylformamidase